MKNDYLKTGDIVGFLENIQSVAGKFCYENKITGRIAGTELNLYIIDVGFPYKIHAKPSELILIADHQKIPILLDVEG